MASPKERIKRVPYDWQRGREAIHSSYPRPPQPNTYQPNRNYNIRATGTSDYLWKAFEDYMDRRRTKYTGLALGRI